MKNIFILFFALISVISTFGQTIKIEEPEFSGVIVYVNDSIGQGTRLEQQVPYMTTKANAAMYIPYASLVAGKVKSKNVVKGRSSKVAIYQISNLKFIIRVNNNTDDPANVINIFKLTQEKETRTIELAATSVLGGSKAGEIEFLQFSAKKYGTSSYIITIDAIELGEYAITLADRRDLFNMFSVKQVSNNPETK